MMRKKAILSSWLWLAAALVLSACGSGYSLRGGVIEPPKFAPDFTLTDQNGRAFRLSDQRGKIVLIFFGYSACPNVCPVSVAQMAAARRELLQEANDVQGVFVTIDPERDSQSRLQRYMSVFDPTFLGLRGSDDELQSVMKAYGVTAVRKEEPNSALGYSIDHSAFIYVIDRTGRLREIMPYGLQVDDLVNDVRFYVHEKG
ncbi:MAG: SCO family protein [Chloroflexi bacterium]|nr:SCO family protein [Chloroflexota bacterium]